MRTKVNQRVASLAMLLAAAVPALCFIGCGPGRDELARMALDTKSADNRREGIVRLSRHSGGLDNAVLPVYDVVAANRSEEPFVRGVAILALGQAGNDKYLPTVLAALDDSQPSVRWDAAVALESLHGPAAIEPLGRHALDDGSADVRVASAKALGHYMDRRAVVALVRCLADKEFGVVANAHKSLTSISGKDFGYDIRAWVEYEASIPQKREAPPSTQPDQREKK